MKTTHLRSTGQLVVPLSSDHGTPSRGYIRVLRPFLVGEGRQSQNKAEIIDVREKCVYHEKFKIAG